MGARSLLGLRISEQEGVLRGMHAQKGNTEEADSIVTVLAEAFKGYIMVYHVVNVFPLVRTSLFHPPLS